MWALEFLHFSSSSLESQEIKKGGENILLIIVFPFKKQSTLSTVMTITWSATFPSSLPAHSNNAHNCPDARYNTMSSPQMSVIL